MRGAGRAAPEAAAAHAHARSRMHSAFHTLYRRRAHLHHYTKYVDGDAIAAADEVVRGLAEEYKALDSITDHGIAKRISVLC